MFVLNSKNILVLFFILRAFTIYIYFYFYFIKCTLQFRTENNDINNGWFGERKKYRSQYSTVQYSKVQYITVQYSTVCNKCCAKSSCCSILNLSPTLSLCLFNKHIGNIAFICLRHPRVLPQLRTKPVKTCPKFNNFHTKTFMSFITLKEWIVHIQPISQRFPWNFFKVGTFWKLF